MNVQTIEVFQQDVVMVPEGGRFFTVRAAFVDYLKMFGAADVVNTEEASDGGTMFFVQGRTGPPDTLRFDWGDGSIDVPFPEFVADGVRLNTDFGAVIGWPAPDGAVM